MNTGKTTYGAILSSINGQPVTDLTRTFAGCTKMVSSPAIPQSIFRYDNTYNSCAKLETAPLIADGVINLNGTFYGCTSLSGVITIDAEVTDYGRCFKSTSKQIYLTGSSSKLAELAATDGYTNNGTSDNVRVLSTTQSSATYMVKHWQQNVTGNKDKLDDENYTVVETQTVGALVGTSVTPSVRTYTGFISPASQTVEVLADNSVVVNYYYTRQVYYIDVNLLWDGVVYNSIGAAKTPVLFTVTVNDKVVAKNVADYYTKHPYGSTYKIELSVKEGYHYDGDNYGSASGVIGAGTASYAPKIRTNTYTTYTVRYWQQNLDGDADIHDSENYTMVSSMSIDALSGTTASHSPSAYTGFNTPAIQGAIVKDDGSTVIDYYYTRKEVAFDINTSIDGVYNVYGTEGVNFTVIVNGKTIASNVSDFCRPILYGSEYSVQVHLSSKYQWDGTLRNGASPMSGIATSAISIVPVITSK